MRKSKTIIIGDHSALADVFILGVHLVDLTEAAEIAGVCRSRIQQLIADGRFTKFIVFGKQKVSFNQLLYWMTGLRPVGRPTEPQAIAVLRKHYAVGPLVVKARAKGVLRGCQRAKQAVSVADGQGRAAEKLRCVTPAVPGAVTLRNCDRTRGGVTVQGVTGRQAVTLRNCVRPGGAVTLRNGGRLRCVTEGGAA